MDLNRREAIIRLAIMIGSTVVGPRLLAANFGQDASAKTAQPKDASSQATADHAPEKFSADELALLDEIGETIIPATNVPGAKAVGIGAFIAMMVTDCYYPNEQASFRKGLRELPAAYQTKYQENFLRGSSANRTAFLNDLDAEQQIYTAKQKERKKFIRENATAEYSAENTGEVPHYFRMLKDLTILGYFTSKIGSDVLGWIEVPGRFDGDVPYAKGDKPGTMMRV